METRSARLGLVSPPPLINSFGPGRDKPGGHPGYASGIPDEVLSKIDPVIRHFYFSEVDGAAFSLTWDTGCCVGRRDNPWKDNVGRPIRAVLFAALDWEPLQIGSELPPTVVPLLARLHTRFESILLANEIGRPLTPAADEGQRQSASEALLLQALDVSLGGFGLSLPTDPKDARQVLTDFWYTMGRFVADRRPLLQVFGSASRTEGLFDDWPGGDASSAAVMTVAPLRTEASEQNPATSIERAQLLNRLVDAASDADRQQQAKIFYGLGGCPILELIERFGELAKLPEEFEDVLTPGHPMTLHLAKLRRLEERTADPAAARASRLRHWLGRHFGVGPGESATSTDGQIAVDLTGTTAEDFAALLDWVEDETTRATCHGLFRQIEPRLRRDRASFADVCRMLGPKRLLDWHDQDPKFLARALEHDTETLQWYLASAHTMDGIEALVSRLEGSGNPGALVRAMPEELLPLLSNEAWRDLASEDVDSFRLAVERLPTSVRARRFPSWLLEAMQSGDPQQVGHAAHALSGVPVDDTAQPQPSDRCIDTLVLSLAHDHSALLWALSMWSRCEKVQADWQAIRSEGVLAAQEKILSEVSNPVIQRALQRPRSRIFLAAILQRGIEVPALPRVSADETALLAALLLETQPVSSRKQLPRWYTAVHGSESSYWRLWLEQLALLIVSPSELHETLIQLNADSPPDLTRESARFSLNRCLEPGQLCFFHVWATTYAEVAAEVLQPAWWRQAAIIHDAEAMLLETRATRAELRSTPALARIAETVPHDPDAVLQFIGAFLRSEI